MITDIIYSHLKKSIQNIDERIVRFMKIVGDDNINNYTLVCKAFDVNNPEIVYAPLSEHIAGIIKERDEARRLAEEWRDECRIWWQGINVNKAKLPWEWE